MNSTATSVALATALVLVGGAFPLSMVLCSGGEKAESETEHVKRAKRTPEEIRAYRRDFYREWRRKNNTHYREYRRARYQKCKARMREAERTFGERVDALTAPPSEPTDLAPAAEGQ